MAKATTLSYGAILAQLGNGATPEVFTSPCGLTQKSLKLSKDINGDVVPDCDDPDAPGWEEQTVKSRSWSYSGGGLLAKEAFKTWREAYESNNSVSIRITVPGSGATGGGHWDGKAQLTSLDISANQGEKFQISIEMVGDGPLTWTSAV